MTMDKMTLILERFMKLNQARKEEFLSYLSTTLGIIENLNAYDEKITKIGEKLKSEEVENG